MFSSWPVSALVDGVKTGSGSRSDSCMPAGSGTRFSTFPDGSSTTASESRASLTLRPLGFCV